MEPYLILCIEEEIGVCALNLWMSRAHMKGMPSKLPEHNSVPVALKPTAHHALLSKPSRGSGVSLKALCAVRCHADAAAPAPTDVTIAGGVSI